MLTNRSCPEEKINLSKSLFKGRTDVFAIRWESKDGKSGYTPACKLEWQKPICRNPEVKCISCQHRTLLPLTDKILFDHLGGKKTIGIYPLLKDETCTFLALDFDKNHWQEDVSVLVNHAIPLIFPFILKDHVQEMAVMFGTFSRRAFLHHCQDVWGKHFFLKALEK